MCSSVVPAQSQATADMSRDTFTHVDVQTLLTNSDFVSLHVPLTKATTHLIGTSELKRMKKTAVLVNTSRGPVIDSKSLYHALAKRRYCDMRR